MSHRIKPLVLLRQWAKAAAAIDKGSTLNIIRPVRGWRTREPLTLEDSPFKRQRRFQSGTAMRRFSQNMIQNSVGIVSGDAGCARSSQKQAPLSPVRDRGAYHQHDLAASLRKDASVTGSILAQIAVRSQT